MLSQGVPLDLLIADLTCPSWVEMKWCAGSARAGPISRSCATGHIDRLMDARPLWEGEAFLDKPFGAAGLREAVSLLLHGTLKKPQ
jgi:hypothetical protein